MKKVFAVLVAAAAVFATAVTATAAKPGPGPIATPASVCRTLSAWGAYSSFSSCMSTINQDVRSYTNTDDAGNVINLDQRCSQLEQGFTDPTGQTFPGITYPFYFGEPDGFPLTQFTAANHHQCELTLYAYHFAFGG